VSVGLELVGLQSLGLDAGASGAGSSDPVIVDVTATDTTAVVTYTGTATHYRLDGGASVAIGASPHTITSLTADTEYDLEITADEVTWTAVYPFGTDNSGSGGGGIPWGTGTVYALVGRGGLVGERRGLAA
jgi:hypothetical protein